MTPPPSLTHTAMWLHALPRVDCGASGLDVAALSRVMTASDTEWGRLVQLPPVARMDGSPTRWARMVAPHGSREPVWLA